MYGSLLRVATTLIVIRIPTYVLASYTNGHGETNTHEPSILVGWHFDEYATHLTLITFLLCVIGIRILYQRLPFVASWIPESLILLLVGVIFGGLLRYTAFQFHFDGFKWTLTPRLFFIYLLPPIILDSAYAMYNRTIVDYMLPILLFAVFGTIMNFLLITVILYAIHAAGWFGKPHIEFNLNSFMLFSSLIVAVDPVAVLAIFQDIGVDMGLYYLVFGESLLNDAVTVVLYKVVSSFSGLEYISSRQLIHAFFSLFTVSLGGLLVGLVVGISTCVFTRAKSSLGALIVLILGYASYILGDCMGWSGIMSMVACGIVQCAYAFHNLSQGSVVVVRKLTKVLAEVCESVIFLFIGLEVVIRDFIWHTGFYLWALISCLLSRALVVLFLTYWINRMPSFDVKISLRQQIILIYGGLRGAVCLCLAVLIKPQYFLHDGKYKRELLITAALFIIFFTVGLMGLTMKQLIYRLHIPMRNEQKLSLFRQLNEHIVDECLSAGEAISGEKGRNVVRDWFIRIDDKYIRRWLQRDPETHDQKILQVYKQIALKLHYAMIEPSMSGLYLHKLPESIKLLYATVKASGGSEVNLFQASSQATLGFGDLQDDHSLPITYRNSSDESFVDESLTQLPVSSKHSRACWCIHKLKRIRRPSARNVLASDTSTTAFNSDAFDVRDFSALLRSSRIASLTSQGRCQTEFVDSLVNALVSKKSILTKNYERASMNDYACHKYLDTTQASSSSLISQIDLNPPMIQLGKIVIKSRTTQRTSGITKRTKPVSDLLYMTANVGPSALPMGQRVAPWTTYRSPWSQNLLCSRAATPIGSVQMKRTKNVFNTTSNTTHFKTPPERLSNRKDQNLR